MASRSQPILRVPKDEAPAVLALTGGERVNVLLYIDPGLGVGQLLEGSEPFVPIKYRSGTRLVARTAIAWLSVHVSHAAEDELARERQRVIVRMSDGHVISGELRWTAPLGRRRTLDHLNDSSGYLMLYDGYHVTFVNKAYVIDVEES